VNLDPGDKPRDDDSPEAQSGRYSLLTYFFFCVSALAATDLASGDAVLLFKIFAAADATDLPVVSFAVFDCVIADAATDFSSFDAVLLFITFAAAEATFDPVLPDLAMTCPVLCCVKVNRENAHKTSENMPDSINPSYDGQALTAAFAAVDRGQLTPHNARGF
jgi:hypothetical protein